MKQEQANVEHKLAKEWQERIRLEKENAALRAALEALIGCVENSAAIEYGDVKELKATDRFGWPEAITLSRAALAAK